MGIQIVKDTPPDHDPEDCAGACVQHRLIEARATIQALRALARPAGGEGEAAYDVAMRTADGLRVPDCEGCAVLVEHMGQTLAAALAQPPARAEGQPEGEAL